VVPARQAGAGNRYRQWRFGLRGGARAAVDGCPGLAVWLAAWLATFRFARRELGAATSEVTSAAPLRPLLRDARAAQILLARFLFDPVSYFYMFWIPQWAAAAPSAGWAIALISGLMLAHGFWITNFLGMLSDLFPASAIGTVTGRSGTAGGIGEVLSNLLVGPLVDHFSFAPAFAVSGVLYPAALLILLRAMRS
jgi:hypothetical protein